MSVLTLNSTKGQTTIIGFLLITIILLVGASLFISTQLPAEQQSQEAVTDEQLHSSYRELPTVVNTATASTTQSYSIDSSIQYEYDNMYAPPQPTISITEPETSQITVETTDTTYQSYTTDKIEYTHNFSRYNPDTTTRYNQNIVYRYEPSNQQIVNPTGQQIIVGDTLNIYDHSITTETNTQINKVITVDTETTTISPSSTLTITITNMNLTQSQAEELFETQLTSRGGNVESVTVTNTNDLQLELQPETYELNTHTVSFE